jgi:hypothetical protein
VSSARNVTQRPIRGFPGSARVTRAGERVLAIANFVKALTALEERPFKRVRFGATPKPSRRGDRYPIAFAADDPGLYNLRHARHPFNSRKTGFRP